MNHLTHFTTVDGTKFTLDLKSREFSIGDETKVRTYEGISGMYVGSSGVTFYNKFNEEFLTTAEIKSVSLCPAESAVEVADPRNVTILTQNSAYEINQEEKMIRRLAGSNNPVYTDHPDGDWKAYLEIRGVALGHRAVIQFPDRYLMTSTIRGVSGTFVGAPDSREVVTLECNIPVN